MPTLGTPVNKTLGATFALIRLYRKQPEFEKEFQRISRLYELPVNSLILQWMESDSQAVLPKDVSKRQAIVNKLRQSIAGENDLSPDACILALDELAWNLKWKFRLPRPLAGWNLFIDRVIERAQELGLKAQVGPSFHPHHLVETSPLSFDISDWQIIEFGQEELVTAFRTALAEYAKNIRAKGVSDYPSSLEKHALWWFKYHVEHKRYDDIAQEEAYSPSGSVISYARNVGAAVRNFSKLLAIKSEDLK